MTLDTKIETTDSMKVGKRIQNDVDFAVAVPTVLVFFEVVVNFQLLQLILCFHG